MRMVKKVIKIVLMEQKPWQEELSKYLRNYRATPHCSTGQIPATVLFSRQMQTKIPAFRTDIQKQVVIRERDNEAKRKMKTYSDNKAYGMPFLIRTGETVIG